MPKIVFIEPSGAKHVVDADVGETVMQAAINKMVPGIVGDCGGFLNCATCHGYIDEQWIEKIPPVSESENDMLDCAFDRRENSRLTCQLTMSDELDGIIVRIPERQV